MLDDGAAYQPLCCRTIDGTSPRISEFEVIDAKCKKKRQTPPIDADFSKASSKCPVLNTHTVQPLDCLKCAKEKGGGSEAIADGFDCDKIETVASFANGDLMNRSEAIGIVKVTMFDLFGIGAKSEGIVVITPQPVPFDGKRCYWSKDRQLLNAPADDMNARPIFEGHEVAVKLKLNFQRGFVIAWGNGSRLNEFSMFILADSSHALKHVIDAPWH